MPPLHPALVHFPLALFPAGFLLDLLGHVLRRPDMTRAGWWLQLAGTFGLVVAIVTGLLARESVLPLASGAEGALMLHEESAFATGGLLLLVFLWRVARKTALPLGSERTFLALYLLGVSLLLLTGWLGGDLVFRFGVGVSQ